MTTSEYLLNAAFVLLVLRQARERELDRRSVIVPLVLMFFVGAQYLHTLPTAGNDLVLIVLLAAVGLTFGVLGGFATQVRAGGNGVALRAGRLDRRRPARLGDRCPDGVRVRGRPWLRAGRAQLQHRAPDRRGRLAGSARADGADRGRRADRDRADPRPPPRRSVTSSDQRAALRPVSAGRSAFYRLPVDKPESAREAQARARADQRLRRQRDILRPLGLVVIAAVAIGAINGHPAPAGHGSGLGVAAALVVFAAALALAVRASFIDRSLPVQTATIAAMAAAGVTLVALQPHGATELAGGAAVWMAVARLPLPLGATLAAATTVGLALAEALAGGSAAVVLAAILLCALLALVAYFIKQARSSQDTTELLLAQLEDAREEQLPRGSGERARPDRERAPRRARALALRCGHPVAGRAQARRARAVEPTGAGRDRARRRTRPRRPHQRPASRRRPPRRGTPRHRPARHARRELQRGHEHGRDADGRRTVRARSRPTRVSRSTAAPRRRSPTSPATHRAPQRPSCSATASASPHSPSRIASRPHRQAPPAWPAWAAGTA